MMFVFIVLNINRLTWWRLNKIKCVSLEAFAVTKFNEIFLGRQLCPDVKVFQCCMDYRSADKVLSPTRKETSYSGRRLWCSYILFIIIIGGILVLFMYITRLTSNEIFSPSNKIHGVVGRAKDLSAPRYLCPHLQGVLVIW
jgi:hypothetical protein